MNEAKVSVIMPCFNDGKYIGDAIDSILRQTYPRWDLIIVDDGSTDEATVAFLGRIHDPKVQVLRKPNGGVSSARNHGIRQTDAEYILPFDADDIAESNYLEKAVATLESDPAIGVVSCHERFFPGTQFDKTLRVWEPKGGGVENFLLTSNANANSVMRRRCWQEAGGYDERLPSHEDWAFWLKVVSLGWQISVVPEVLLHYRRSEASKFTKNVRNRPQFVKHIVEDNIDVFRQHVAFCLARKEEEILEMKDAHRVRVEKIRKSRECQIGRALLWPWRKFREAIGRS